MGSVNQVTLVGNLGADPELKYTASNKPVCNLSIATTYRPKEGQEQTEWHRVTAWNADAENCAKFLSKGRAVYIQGRLATRTYEKDGHRHKSTEIMAERVVFLGGPDKPANRQQPIARGPGPSPALATVPNGAPPDDDDNLPW